MYSWIYLNYTYLETYYNFLEMMYSGCIILDVLNKFVANNFKNIYFINIFEQPIYLSLKAI
jgi:hypothetical protein